MNVPDIKAGALTTIQALGQLPQLNPASYPQSSRHQTCDPQISPKAKDIKGDRGRHLVMIKRFLQKFIKPINLYDDKT